MAKLKTLKEKKLWNRAIEAARKQILLYDGLVPDERDRTNLADGIAKRLKYVNID